MMPDQSPVDLPDNAFSYARNCRFAGGYAGRMGGHISIFGTPSTTPLFVLPLLYSSSRFVIYPGTNKIYAHDGTTETDVTGSAPTGVASDKWTGDNFNGLAILNNGVDVPQYWDGNTANNFAAFPTWDATERCKSVRSFRNFIVTVNITKGATKYPQLVKWSDTADPGAMPNSWDETDPTTLAGEFPLADTQGDLIDSLPLGGVNIIYKTDGYYEMAFVDGQEVFAFRLLDKNSGLLSQNCAVAFPGGHACIGNGDIYVHNGGQSQSIVSERDRDYFFGNMDADNSGLCFAAVNPSKKEVWFCAPDGSGTGCTYALVWNWETNGIGHRQIPNAYHANAGQVDISAISVWDSFTDVWDDVTETWNQLSYNSAEQRMVIASADTKLYLPDRSQYFNEVDYTSTLERTGLVLGDPTETKLVRNVWPRFDAVDGTTIQIRVGSQSSPDQAVTWGPWFRYVVGTNFRADLFARGRFIAYAIQSTSGATWRIKGLTFGFDMAGGF